MKQKAFRRLNGIGRAIATFESNTSDDTFTAARSSKRHCVKLKCCLLLLCRAMLRYNMVGTLLAVVYSCPDASGQIESTLEMASCENLR